MDPINRNWRRDRNAPLPGYDTYRSTAPGKRDQATDWIMQGDNADEWIRQIAPNQKPNMMPDDEGTRALLEQMRNMMQMR